MTVVFNSTLREFMNLSSTVCIPQGYDKVYPEQSVDAPGFVPNNYYNLMGSFADATNAFEYFKQLAQIIINRPFNPLYADALLLDTLKNLLGLNFIVENLSGTELRRVLYAKLLANVNNGTIKNTIDIYKTLMNASWVQRVRLGIGTVDISYCAVGGNLPISLDELAMFWYAAHTGGIYIELRKAPLDYFAFLEDPDGLGFSTLSHTGEIVKAVPPYFGFLEDPEATGFSTIDDPITGGQMCTLVLPSEGGGSFATIVFNQQGAS